MAINWTDAEVRAAYFCTAEVVRWRRLKGQPIPQVLREVNNRLEVEVQVRMSRSRQELDTAAAQLVSDSQIGAAEAAEILNWSRRQVQRRAKDLDGQIVGGSWIFRRAAVVDYAEEVSSSARADEGGDRAAPRRDL